MTCVDRAVVNLTTRKRQRKRRAMWKFIFLVFLSSHINGIEVETGMPHDLPMDKKCNTDEECWNFGRAFCNFNHFCECQSDAFVYYVPYNTTCLPKAAFIGDDCEISKQCSYIQDVEAECKNNTCTSKDGPSSSPTRALPFDNCTKTSDCSNDRICLAGMCISPTGAPVVEPVGSSLGSSCENDTDCEKGETNCVVGVCQCAKGFVPSQNLKNCLPKAKSLGDPCTESAQCVSLNGGVCENQICKEIPNMVRTVAASIPNILIGSTCQTDEECKHLSNATCLDHVCQCPEAYVVSLTSKSCLPKAKTEGDACEIDKQCESVKGSICSKGKCVKPAIAGTKIGGSSEGHVARPTLLAGAFIIIKMFFV